MVGRDALLFIAMSVQSDTPTGTCFECRETFELPGYNGDVCSEECFYIQKGDNALNLLRYDHRLCASCGRWLKEISPPTEEWTHQYQSLVETALRQGAEYTNGENGIELNAVDVKGSRPTNTECVIGFEYATKHATDVVREYGNQEYSIQRIKDTGLGCECGNADTSFVSETLQSIELATVLANYVKVFRALEREGQLDQRINKDIFFSAFKESRDLKYALGKGLHGSS